MQQMEIKRNAGIADGELKFLQAPGDFTTGGSLYTVVISMVGFPFWAQVANDVNHERLTEVLTSVAQHLADNGAIMGDFEWVAADPDPASPDEQLRRFGEYLAIKVVRYAVRGEL
jgi:hypothetical protein